MANKRKSVLVVDGNLFARRVFYKFQHLSSKIKFRDLESLAPSLLKVYFPETEYGRILYL